MIPSPHPAAPASSHPSTAPNTGMSILIVDDSRLQRRILGSSIRRWGYGLHEAESAEEALEICNVQHVDIVLCDWMMPGMSGPEFCRVFRNMDRKGYGYFILLTSKSAKEEVAQGLEAGADDFLTKPVHPDELRARIIAGQRVQSMEQELRTKNCIVSDTLAQLQVLYDKIDRDLIEARKLQQSLVRERHRDFGGAKVNLLLQPCGHVGGDLVGMFPINERKIGIYGIDVSGHGIASALMTARLAGLFPAGKPDQNIAIEIRDGALIPRSPAAVAMYLNELVLQEIETEQYFTLLLGHLDLFTGEVVMTQSGHPHPIVLRASGHAEFHGVGGLPVGLIEGAQYEDFSVSLDRGDRLLFVSDGITECTDQNGLMLSRAQLSHLLKQTQSLPGDQAAEALVQGLAEQSGKSEFEDDISIVLVDFSGVKRICVDSSGNTQP